MLMMTDLDDAIEAFMSNPLTQVRFARFLRVHGTRMIGASLPSGIRRGKAKACFMNAWDTAISHKLHYFEGLAWDADRPEAPFLHAWCYDPARGAVVEPTWPSDAETRYVGVHVPTDLLLDIVIDSGTFGVLDKGRGFERATAKKHWGWVDQY